MDLKPILNTVTSPEDTKSLNLPSLEEGDLDDGDFNVLQNFVRKMKWSGTTEKGFDGEHGETKQDQTVKEVSLRKKLDTERV